MRVKGEETRVESRSPENVKTNHKKKKEIDEEFSGLVGVFVLCTN